LSLEADDCETTKRCLNQIQQFLGPATDNVKMEEGDEAQPEYRFTTAVKVEFRLIAALLAAHLGDVKEAKDLLKTTHRLLDSSDAASSAFNDGAVSRITNQTVLRETRSELRGFDSQVRVIGQNDPKATAPASVRFELPSHSSLYSFTYLASVVSTRFFRIGCSIVLTTLLCRLFIEILTGKLLARLCSLRKVSELQTAD